MIDFSKQLEKKNRTLLYFCIIIFVFIFLLFFIFITSFFLLQNFITKERVDQQKPQFTHRYFQYNPQNEEKTIGFVQLSFEQNSKFFVVDDGKHHLISPIEGSEDFICRGTCTCETYQKSQRKSAGVHVSLRSSLIFLVATVSSFLAYQKAENYFEERCHEVLDCPEDSFVRSTVEDCEPRIQDDESNHEKEKEDSTNTDHSYLCTGHCLPVHIDDQIAHLQIVAEELFSDGFHSQSPTGNFATFIRELYDEKCTRRVNCNQVTLTKVFDRAALERHEFFQYTLAQMEEEEEFKDYRGVDHIAGIFGLGEEVAEKVVTTYFADDLDVVCRNEGRAVLDTPPVGIPVIPGMTEMPTGEPDLVCCEGYKGVFLGKVQMEAKRLKTSLVFETDQNPAIRCVREK